MYLVTQYEYNDIFSYYVTNKQIKNTKSFLEGLGFIEITKNHLDEDCCLRIWGDKVFHVVKVEK